MENLTYRDLSGRPKPRRFILAAAGISLFLVGIGWYAFAGSLPLFPTEIEAAPTLSSGQAPGAVNGLNKLAAALPPAPSACPTNPRDWSFVRVFPADNYLRIEPACVYDGLSRTVAWLLLERLGYTKQSAADALGLRNIPWKPNLTITGLTNSQGPLELNLVPEWPAHPDFRFWQVDREGQPGVALGLRGCYFLKDTVHCVVALDRMPGSAVSALGDLHFASHAAQLPGQRTFLLLEYDGAGEWYLRGQLAGISLELADLGSSSDERAALAERLGAVSWDAPWLFETYGLHMVVLPEGWRLWEMNEQAVLAIGAELDRFIPAGIGGGDD